MLRALALAGLVLLFLTGCFRLDRFMFAPWIVDEYHRPEDVDSLAWDVRGIIPDSLYDEVELVSSNGNRIYGFLVRQPQDTARERVTVLYCHGNSHCINRYWGRVELLWEMGFRVFIFDYQGYGRSEGGPNGDACFADGRAALAYLRGLGTVDPERVIYYGWSMGTFVATYLAADSLVPFGLVLESPPASAEALVNEGTVFNVPGSMLTGFDFDNVERIPRVGVPVLLMHGTEDRFLNPARHAQRVIDAAEGHVTVYVAWVCEAGHEDVPRVLGDRYPLYVLNYLRLRTGGK